MASVGEVPEVLAAGAAGSTDVGSGVGALPEGTSASVAGVEGQAVRTAAEPATQPTQPVAPVPSTTTVPPETLEEWRANACPLGLIALWAGLNPEAITALLKHLDLEQTDHANVIAASSIDEFAVEIKGVTIGGKKLSFGARGKALLFFNACRAAVGKQGAAVTSVPPPAPPTIIQKLPITSPATTAKSDEDMVKLDEVILQGSAK